MNSKQLIHIKANAILGIILNIVWLSMSFGLMVANLTTLVILMAIVLINGAIIIGKITTEDLLEFRKTTSKSFLFLGAKYLGWFLLLMLIFGQLVFSWYLVLYYILLIGMLFTVGAELMKEAKEILEREAQENNSN